MKTRLLLLAILLVLTAAVVCVSILLAPPAQVVEPVMPAEIPEGYAAENNFTFREVFEEGAAVDAAGNPVTGVTHTLAEYAGQPVAVIFWASWSAAGRDQLDEVEAVLAEYEGRAAILPVNVGKAGKDSEKKARIALGSSDLPLYVDKTGVVAFNVTSPPKTLFFDGMGNLAAEVNGLCRAETIRETLDRMLAGGERE
ncbi:MAG: TlpA family protein disulfide reductase [Clostridia bacterium]|nr:TlpA family protein disulfide reductase [Clostridia bacterium]